MNISVLDSKRYSLSNSKTLIYELKPNHIERDYFTNRFGMRDKDYPIEKDPDTLRIIMLGDSVLFGPYIANENLFSELVEKELNNGTSVEILNTGVSGYDIYQEFEILQEFLYLKPDLVVLDTYPNDHHNKFNINKEEALSIFEYSEEYPFLIDFKGNQFLLRNFYFYRFFNAKAANILGFHKFSYSLSMDRYKKVLKQMKSLSCKQNMSFIVVFHPFLVDNNDTDYIEYKDRIDDYVKVFNSLNVTYLDLSLYYREYNVTSLRIIESDPAHLNEAGHEITAKIILDYLKPKLNHTRDVC